MAFKQNCTEYWQQIKPRVNLFAGKFQIDSGYINWTHVDHVKLDRTLVA